MRCEARSIPSRGPAARGVSTAACAFRTDLGLGIPWRRPDVGTAFESNWAGVAGTPTAEARGDSVDAKPPPSKFISSSPAVSTIDVAGIHAHLRSHGAGRQRAFRRDTRSFHDAHRSFTTNTRGFTPLARSKTRCHEPVTRASVSTVDQQLLKRERRVALCRRAPARTASRGATTG